MAKQAAKLYKVEQIVDRLTLIAGIVALWTFSWPYPYAAAIVASLVIPILVLVVFKTYGGKVQIDERDNNLSPTVFWAFLLPSIALFIRALTDYHIFDDRKIWGMVWPLAVGLMVIILVRQAEFKLRKRKDILSILAMTMLVFIYSFGAVITSNYALDTSEAVAFKTQILHKNSTSSYKSTTYYVELAPWGPQPGEKETQVNRRLYDQMEVGDSVEILFLKGRWGIPWYIVRP